MSEESGDLRLFTGYVFYAGIATLIDFSVLYVLTSYVGLWYFYSAAAAYITGMLTNFSLNKKYNFRNKSRKIIQQFMVFAAVAVTGLTLNQAIIYMLVEKARLWYIHTKIVSVAVVMS